MQTKHHWGTKWWGLFHTLAIIYDDAKNDQEKHEKLECIKNLFKAIPCLACRVEFTNYYESFDKLIAENLSMFALSVELHNTVNKRLDKQEISYDDAVSIWSQKL